MANLFTRFAGLIRFGLWLLVGCAALAAVSLVVEFYGFTQTLPDQGWNLQIARLVGLVFLNLVFAVLLAIVVGLVLWVRLAGTLPDLQGWHTQFPASEFRAADAHAHYTLDDYVAQEQRVYDELQALIDGPWAAQSVDECQRSGLAGDTIGGAPTCQATEIRAHERAAADPGDAVRRRFDDHRPETHYRLV